jgi:group I intron endonuclease
MFSQGYIGITNSIKYRFESHKNRAQNKHLKNAIDKYGWDNLIKEVVLVSDKSYCLMIEKILRPLKNIGWNIVEGGGMPPKTLKGCNKGKPSWNKGKPHSEQTRKKLSNALKGRKTWNKGVSPSEETRVKYSIAKIGKPSNRKGKVNSEEHRLKISLAKKGKRQSDEVYKKQGLSRMGKKQTLIECPHCHKIGGNATMPRWHFNNCKEKV